MTKKITSYKALVAETERLSLQLDEQKNSIALAINDVGDNLYPTIKMVNTVGKFATYNPKAFLLTTISDFIIDSLVNVSGLKDKNWISGIIIPEALKNYSSHYLVNHKEDILSFIETILNKIISNTEEGDEDLNTETTEGLSLDEEDN